MHRSQPVGGAAAVYASFSLQFVECEASEVNVSAAVAPYVACVGFFFFASMFADVAMSSISLLPRCAS